MIRNKHDQSILSFKANGVSHSNGNQLQNGHMTDDASSTRSHSKENHRRSFFGVSKTQQSSIDGDGGDGDWVTDSGADRNTSMMDRSLTNDSHTRPDTASSVGSKVGVVKRRLSMLKLGKKSSKASVMVDRVIEECE